MASVGNFIGYSVKVDCGFLGIFEGRVSSVEDSTITLEDGNVLLYLRKGVWSNFTWCINEF